MVEEMREVEVVVVVVVVVVKIVVVMAFYHKWSKVYFS